MASKIRLKFVEILWIFVVCCCQSLVECRPQNDKSFIAQKSDPSDRTLIRVLRSDFEEEEKAEEFSNKRVKKDEKAAEHMPPLKKRATEEDQFFQALLSRANERPIEKRSYESQPEKEDVRENWKGDSKISDADRNELEHLFNNIGMVENEDPSSKTKFDAKRATKTGLEGKVQDLVEWLMAQPPKEFHDSLRHIIDVERSVSDLFVIPPDQTMSSITNTTDTNYDGATTESYTTDTTSPGTVMYGGTPTIASPAATSAYPQSSSQPTSYTQTQPYTTQPGYNQASAQTQTQNSKKGYSYADAVEAAQTMSHSGPGPIPHDALDYFNKFSGGIANVHPQLLTNYGVHPQELHPAPAVHPQQQPAASQQHDAAVLQAPTVQQQQRQAPAVQQQQAPAVQQQQQMPAAQSAYSAQSAYPAQYQQAGYAAQYLYRPQNSNYGRQSASYARPYRVRGNGYTPPPARPYPMNKDELDEPTEKNVAQVTLLFKQSWSNDLTNKSSTKYRIFKDEVKKELSMVFETRKNFKKIVINKIKEDRGKASVTFTVRYAKKTSKPLKALYERISRDKLGNMPVFRDTLLREGKTHQKNILHRSRTLQKKESENPATEFAQFTEQMDRELTGENIPLNVKHEAYQGCFKDKKPHRDMKKHFSKFEMTPEWCVHTCKREGYRFAGVQYSYLCFCGNKFGKYGKVPNSECNSRCYGDKNRFCGAFWHNSIYSIDGQHHEMNEFSAIPDEEGDDEEKDDKQEDSKDSGGQNDKQHAAVANHLMKAASSALKAAKKLLPGKNKRHTDEEFSKNKQEAEKSLKAVDEIVETAKTVHKRSTGNGDGKNLLMAYLGNVGGYDREYRSVEDENTPVEKLKFDYKRMIIDEEGDGEFISKAKNKKKLKRSRRSVENEDEENDGRKKMASRAVDDSGGATNPKSAIAEPSRRELLTKDSSDNEIKRRSRDTTEDEEDEEEADLAKTRKSKKNPTKKNTTKRSVSIDKSLYHSKVEEGMETKIGEVLDAMKGTSDISMFKDSIEKLTIDVTNGLAIPDDQKVQVTSDIRSDVKQTGTARMNMLVAAIRTEFNEYGEMHPAVGPQADEASKTMVDVPLDQTTADNIKNKIRKRSTVETENDNEEKEKSFLSDMLKEHSQKNN